MNDLFGIPMTDIMIVLVALFGVAVASVLFIYLTNRVMFRMGLRNLPRRGLQTGLVVIGLMLSTLIVTAAFTTGDTIDYSITKQAYDGLQRTDLAINLRGKDVKSTSGEPVYISEAAVGGLEQKFAGDADIDGFQPFLFEPVPAINQRTQLSEPQITLSGVDVDRMTRLGGIALTNGNKANLGQLSDTDVLLGRSAADELKARVGDVVTIRAAGQPVDLRVAGIVNDQLATGGDKQFYEKYKPGAVMRLSAVQSLTGHAGQIDYLGVALKGGVRDSMARSDAAALRLQPYLQSAEGQTVLGAGDRAVEVQKVKQDAIEEAQLNGNLFTTFFLVLGLFSMAAGIMLIFMIFVMLAAERKPEMGMARAVGAQRGSLLQSFVAEGMAYSVIAGAIGAAAGVGAALALVLGFLRIAGGFDFLTAHITLRSLVVSYCLGVVVTFLTVVIASFKVSHVNIVAAIRGTDEDRKRQPRAKTRWRWVLAGIPAMVIPPLGIWFLLRKGFGIAWTWIIAPAGLVVAALSILGAKSTGSEALFSFGFSLVPLCIAMIAAHYRAPSRPTWTAVGLYLGAYWLSPFKVGEHLLGRKLNGDIEMFVISGVMVVIASTLVIVFNGRLLTTLFQRTNSTKAAYRTPAIVAALAVASVAGAIALGHKGDGLGQLLYLAAAVFAIVAAVSFFAVRLPRFAPALKMGVAYPLSNRFRTGMTIAMFSLIIFSLTVFSTINATFAQLLSGKDGDGGWNLVATANRNNPVGRLGTVLIEKQSATASDIAAEGRVTAYTGSQEVRQAGQQTWKAYPVVAGDDAFFAMPQASLEDRADGYASDRAVLDAVRTQPNLAVIDGIALHPDNGGGVWDWAVNATVNDHRFQPFDVSFRDPLTGKSGTVTVIGVLSSKLTEEYISGVYTNSTTYSTVYGQPAYQRSFIRLQPGIGARAAADRMEAALATEGVQVKSIKALLDEGVAQNQAFLRMFQGFMALGLFVGIAALGVIAFRSVVERRQQIGMLRAIGYQSGTVALTFVLESSFIALMGILSGVVGGEIIARNLFTTGQFSDAGVQFAIPWAEVIGFMTVAFVFSLFMTWWPSRNAARVPIADALRYE